MSEAATITALVHGKQTAVSFRHLSSILNVPTRRAQKLLHDFAASDPTVTVLWCVTEQHPKTGIHRTSLTIMPPADAKKQIWAVGPASAANALSKQAVWLVSDVARDRTLVTQAPHVKNELRDGRWNQIQSNSGVWDPQLDPRLEGDERLAACPANASAPKLNSSSLLVSVKAKAKGRKTKSSGANGGVFKSSSVMSASLFASKPLGAQVMQKKGKSSSKQSTKCEEYMSKSKTELEYPKDENESVEKRKVGTKKQGKQHALSKKTRKVVDYESDSEDPSAPEVADGEDNEERECIRELEREAAEKEKADAERAELEQELMELNREDVDEDPESPELKELPEHLSANHEVNSSKAEAEVLECSPDSEKRSFWQTFGDDPNGTKRVRKQVEETVEEDGYFVTRRVIKIFDEHGNEVKDAGPVKPLPEANQAVRDLHPEENPPIPLRTKTRQSTKEKFSASILKRDTARDSKRPNSKLGQSNKKTLKKKTKGNIMSYFGKKT